MAIQPFTLRIAQSELNDLKLRLAATRWIESIDDDSWREGTSLNFMRHLVDYWRDRFDWRAQEARLNAFPHFIAGVDGQQIHFIHQRGKGPSPMPLILTHGWPGSFVEMLDIIPYLTDPARFGGSESDAFDVIVPSLPGYGFSSAPTVPGVGAGQTAHLWAALMGKLGYGRFALQGGDLGAGVSSWLARLYSARVIGLHLNFIPGSYRPYIDDKQPLTEEEQDFAGQSAAWANEQGAYGHVQGTRPQSLAFALNDSPAGLAAWIAEKFRAWSDCDGDLEKAISLDVLLTNISLYWFTRTIGSSFRMYVEGRRNPLLLSAGERISPPLAVAHFPKELPMPPQSWVRRGYNLQRWSSMPHGGHFAALECPQELAADIRRFFNTLR
ncbi:epoxide hydrolase family protein [Sodalis ligni]|uniref:Pimeloyl-ACP methyl ester carboxylesterase n=1 Tax=Sodalis ligni TaxID=2697027 RepID=A0A4R1NLE8_9GAMM|nr:epoxide hydrolase family protein [Sodalis ligni]TCL06781.1 pimeloyl-ACP methyl ester carboxylesterase [Sodalis ligni]